MHLKYIVTGSVIAFFAACGGGNKKPKNVITAPTAPCTATAPIPPDPLPAGFDWSALAKDYCGQLAACGLSYPECERDYVTAINQPPGEFPISGPPVGEETGVDTLACEDSKEAETNPEICNTEVEQPREPTVP